MAFLGPQPGRNLRIAFAIPSGPVGHGSAARDNITFNILWIMTRHTTIRVIPNHIGLRVIINNADFAGTSQKIYCTGSYQTQNVTRGADYPHPWPEKATCKIQEIYFSFLYKVNKFIDVSYIYIYIYIYICVYMYMYRVLLSITTSPRCGSGGLR